MPDTVAPSTRGSNATASRSRNSVGSDAASPCPAHFPRLDSLSGMTTTLRDLYADLWACQASHTRTEHHGAGELTLPR